MPRPPKCRWVEQIPQTTYFKPAGIPLKHLQEVHLCIEEVEAVRLKDLEGLEQEDCAEKMGVSRPTFHRIINGARHKIARALIGGQAIRIKGGNFCLVSQSFRCSQCGQTWEMLPEENQKEIKCPKCQSAKQNPLAKESARHRKSPCCSSPKDAQHKLKTETRGPG